MNKVYRAVFAALATFALLLTASTAAQAAQYETTATATPTSVKITVDTPDSRQYTVVRILANKSVADSGEYRTTYGRWTYGREVNYYFSELYFNPGDEVHYAVYDSWTSSANIVASGAVQVPLPAPADTSYEVVSVVYTDGRVKVTVDTPDTSGYTVVRVNTNKSVADTGEYLFSAGKYNTGGNVVFSFDSRYAQPGTDFHYAVYDGFSSTANIVGSGALPLP